MPVSMLTIGRTSDANLIPTNTVTLSVRAGKPRRIRRPTKMDASWNTVVAHVTAGKNLSITPRVTRRKSVGRRLINSARRVTAPTSTTMRSGETPLTNNLVSTSSFTPAIEAQSSLRLCSTKNISFPLFLWMNSGPKTSSMSPTPLTLMWSRQFTAVALFPFPLSIPALCLNIRRVNYQNSTSNAL